MTLSPSKLILLYISSVLILIIGVIFGVESYISAKKERLYTQMKDSVEQMFNGKDHITDVLYYDNTIEAKRIGLPPLSFDQIQAQYKDEVRTDWEDLYGDIEKLYWINSDLTQSIYGDTRTCKDGWRLVILEHTNEGIDVKFIFPYGVGYRKQESSFDYLFAPKLEERVASGLTFLLQDPMSEMRSSFEKGKFNYINTRLKSNKLDNQYYTIPYLSEYQIRQLPETTSSIWDVKLLSPQSYTRWKDNAGPMIYPHQQVYNAYTKLYIGHTYPIHLNIFEKESEVQTDLVQRIAIFIGLGLIILSSLALIAYRIIKSRPESPSDDSLKHNTTSLLLLLLILPLNSCKKSMEEVFDAKEKGGCTILKKTRNDFHYIEDQSLWVYSDNDGQEHLLYNEGQTEVRLFNIKHSITDNGEIIANRDYTDKAYEGYYGYPDFGEILISQIKPGFIPNLVNSKDEKSKVLDRGGIIVTIDGFSYLSIPTDGKQMDFILIDELEYKTSEINYEKGEMIFEYFFTLSDLPSNLQPKFHTTPISYIFYSEDLNEYGGFKNPCRWIVAKTKLHSDGKIEVMDSIYMADSNIRFPKEILKNTAAFRDSIEHNALRIIDINDMRYR